MFVIVLRTVFLYAFVSLAMRIMGKKQVGQLQPVEFVIILLLSELASIPMQDMKISVMHSVIPILTLMLLELLSSALGIKFRRLRLIFDGSPSILVKHGKIDSLQMRRARYNVDELLSALRLEGINDIRDVEYAILETGGSISVITTADSRPLTPSDMDIKAKKEGFPCIVINDGKISDIGLKFAGKDRRQLSKILKEHQIEDINTVLYAVLSTNGDFYYQLREENKNA